jgi:hypothetical protein
MSVLNDKINSYTLERGIEFNQAYTLTPTRTGSNPLGTWALQNGPAPVFEPTVGPAGGAGSWRYNCPTSGAPRFNTTNANELLGIADEDWTMGFWFKMSALPTLTTPSALTFGINVFSVTPSSVSAGWTAFVVPTNSTATYTFPANQGGAVIPLAGRLIIQMGGQNDVYTPVLEPNTWYYIACRRVGTAQSGFFNGQLVKTVTNSELNATPARISFSSSSHQGTNSPQIWISNFHYSTAASVDANAISEIYTAGLGTVGRTVKYFNGTSWVDSTGQKVWNGTAWVDWNAKRFDGSAWVNV